MDLDIETTGAVHTEIRTRGLPLDGALRQAVAVRSGEFRRRFPGLAASLSVRVFAIAGAAPRLDRGCLVCATRTAGGDPLIASEVGGDAVRAVHGAVGKLERLTQAMAGSRMAEPVFVRSARSRPAPGLTAGA